MTLLKPRALAAGDRIAVVSPSWGGPGIFPQRYEAGKRQLEAEFGVTVIDMAHARADAAWLSANPQARAEDLMAAFADESIAGIFSSIGGDDCIRLLPYLDLEVLRQNPKVFLGFSDTTSLHLACYAAGITSFYGPSIMAGFAENGGMHRYTADGVRRVLFSSEPAGPVPLNTEGWTAERLEWGDPALQQQRRRLQPADAPLVLQGHGIAEGHLLGGCAEVLEMVKGTAWWPPLEAWRGAILFIETSEEAPPVEFLRYWLRNYAAQGILGVLNGIILARPDPKGDAHYRERQEQALLTALGEAGRADLPVLSGLDFGHTQPMLTLPYGARVRIDCAAGRLTILEAGVA
ncbi:LD-carboxypeptidase [Devosia yakushimensis]|uniref:LD-carboxypeptidase n=1 Tax=Devosia yakushimensis TaxID=470028 RepID=A0ABQ5UGV6_9HYPH|nr:S66 peptidase family protein [Devosia yakushimensis]GLQ09791.1 LD-carboxypeptidase [Devosia yakushimensis]